MNETQANRSTEIAERRAQALRSAANAKRQAAIDRADAGLRAMVKDGQAVDFRALARAAGVSVNFLYHNAELRSRIEQLRNQQDRPERSEPAPDSHSAVIRTLTAKLTAERRRRLDEVALLREQLAAAHGELLQLRRAANVMTGPSGHAKNADEQEGP